MIAATLGFLAGELDAYLARSLPAPVPERRVVLSGLSSASGGLPQGLDNKVALTLVNLEREGAVPTAVVSSRAAGGYQRGSMALHLNLYVLAAASFESRYEDGLVYLDAVLAFFQGRQQFSRESSPRMPSSIERLSVDFVSLEPSEMQNIWSVVGAKYLPSALYRIRMVTIQQDWMTELLPAIADADAAVRS